MGRIFLLLVPALMAFINLSAKKTLSHEDFDSWQKVNNIGVSNNGEWMVFSVNPQEGDGILTFQNTINNKKIDIERGYQPKISADSKWGFALIKPFYGETRTAKIKKTPSHEMPADSLAVINFKTGKVTKIPNVTSYKIGKDGGEWVAWLSNDTAYIDKSSLSDKKAGRPMIMMNLNSGSRHRMNWVKEYLFSNDGTKLAVTMKKSDGDSLATNGTGVVILPDTAFHMVDRDKSFYGKPVFSNDGNSLAYIASNDSVDSGTKEASLFHVNLSAKILEAKEIPVTAGMTQGPHRMKPHAANPETQEKLEEQWGNTNMKNSENLSLNQYSIPVFSYNGKRLVVGVGKYVAPDDTTLIDFEKPVLDIWRWDSPMTPPMEIAMADSLQRQTFPVVIDLATGNQTLVTRNPLAEIQVPDRWDADWALIGNTADGRLSLQWDYFYPVPLSIKNIVTGEEREIITAKNELYELSPCGKYVMWYKDRTYHVYEIATGKITTPAAKIPYPLWEEKQDLPLDEKEPYGSPAWSENDKELLVYDRYDVWCLDPKGEKDPVCLTAGEGRKKNLTFRIIDTDPEKRFVKPGENILYSVFDNETKRNGLADASYKTTPSAPRIAFLDEYTYRQVRRGKNSLTTSWILANFNTSPNVYYTRDLNKKSRQRVTDSNPQMGDYNWGTAQLFKWYAYDGSPAEGILYLPEDFNPDESYPMLIYFYETCSELLYHHFDLEPSWSWINIPFFVGRGYAVFIPDVFYTAGLPGESAWNYVCSGAEEICRQFPNIDKKRIGIDGQSWGGYQTAYLVTRTNMFACAGSGAPVANMTSAYGGIRWGEGDSRQAQYEMGQSRIGRTLWDAQELYIANSPVFHADRVQTPLLIMHNDNDGAVPWYQGIEMFMALRRLGKPVWMLQYNDEAHNIRERKNRKDITIRLQQFFDHYLKGDPMPEWMKNGIPIVRKGQEFGY